LNVGLMNAMTREVADTPGSDAMAWGRVFPLRIVCLSK